MGRVARYCRAYAVAAAQRCLGLYWLAKTVLAALTARSPAEEDRAARRMRRVFRSFLLQRAREIRPSLAIAGIGCLAIVALWPETYPWRFLAAIVCVLLPTALYLGWPRMRHWNFRSKFLQFRLATALALVTAAAIGLKRLEPYYGQQQLIAAANKHKGWAHTEPMLPAWVPDRVGTLEIASRFRRVKQMHVFGITDADLAAIAHMPGANQIDHISVQDSSITDAGLVHLRHFKACRDIYFVGCGITDSGLPHFEQVPKLRSIWLGDAKVTEAGVEQFERRRENRYQRRITIFDVRRPAQVAQ